MEEDKLEGEVTQEEFEQQTAKALANPVLLPDMFGQTLMSVQGIPMIVFGFDMGEQGFVQFGLTASEENFALIDKGIEGMKKAFRAMNKVH